MNSPRAVELPTHSVLAPPHNRPTSATQDVQGNYFEAILASFWFQGKPFGRHFGVTLTALFCLGTRARGLGPPVAVPFGIPGPLPYPSLYPYLLRHRQLSDGEPMAARWLMADGLARSCLVMCCRRWPVCCWCSTGSRGCGPRESSSCSGHCTPHSGPSPHAHTSTASCWSRWGLASVIP